MTEGTDLLETTHSETVPLLSDDHHHGTWSRRRKVGKERALRCCGQSTAALTRRLNKAFGLLCPFYLHLFSGEYTAKMLASDTLTGFTMSVFHIPQGLSYGLMAGLRPVNGLYTSLIPVAIYCLFGRSRHLSLGTFSLTSLLLADMVSASYRQYMLKLGVNDTIVDNATLQDNEDNVADGVPSSSGQYLDNISAEEYAKLQVAIIGSFAASIISIILGVLHLGFLMKFISNPMLRGFTTAASVYIFTTQVPMMLGISPTEPESVFKLVSRYIGIAGDITSTNWATVITSIVCILTLLLIKECVNPRVKKYIKVPVPAELLILLLALAASHLLHLEANYRVTVVGPVPRGLPTALLPDFGFMPNVIVGSLPVGFFGCAITLSIVRMYANEFEYSVNYNQELVVLGVSNLFGSFFQCFFATGALARNAVVVSAGMQSQMASAVSCLVMLVIVVAAGPILEFVPDCALAAIIVVSLFSFFKQVADLPKLWRTARLLDLSVWIVTAAAVLVIDVSIGMVVGLGFSLISSVAAQIAEFVRQRRQRRSTSVLRAEAARYPMMIGPTREHK